MEFTTWEKGVGNHEVKWKCYDYVSTGKLTTDGKDMKKIALVEKCTGPKELFDYFIQLLGQFPYHSFLAKWQREQLDSLLETFLLIKPCAFMTILRVMPVPIL